MVLVTGIHREDLGFGDRVSALVDADRIDLLRIPRGISRARSGPNDRFYHDAKHREIYLQLRQQVRNRYRLLIDLHSGVNESGRCADVYCSDEAFLARLDGRIVRPPKLCGVRLIKIISQAETVTRRERDDVVARDARTWIPRKIWGTDRPLYVGLEVYLPRAGDGEKADWDYALDVIDRIAAGAGSIA